MSGSTAVEDFQPPTIRNLLLAPSPKPPWPPGREVGLELDLELDGNLPGRFSEELDEREEREREGEREDECVERASKEPPSVPLVPLVSLKDEVRFSLPVRLGDRESLSIVNAMYLPRS